MKAALDFVGNAVVSALIGLLVSIGITLAAGHASLSLAFAGACSAVGAVCGTSSKAIIEGAFLAFGRRPALAYLLNAAVTTLIVLGFIRLYFGGIGDMDPILIIIAFVVPIAASSAWIRRALAEAKTLTEAFDRKRRSLDDARD